MYESSYMHEEILYSALFSRGLIFKVFEDAASNLKKAALEFDVYLRW